MHVCDVTQFLFTLLRTTGLSVVVRGVVRCVVHGVSYGVIPVRARPARHVSSMLAVHPAVRRVVPS